MFYEISPHQFPLLRECLRHIESGRKVNIMQTNGRPHGANAMMADTIQARILDFVVEEGKCVTAAFASFPSNDP